MGQFLKDTLLKLLLDENEIISSKANKDSGMNRVDRDNLVVLKKKAERFLKLTNHTGNCTSDLERYVHLFTELFFLNEEHREILMNNDNLERTEYVDSVNKILYNLSDHLSFFMVLMKNSLFSLADPKVDLVYKSMFFTFDECKDQISKLLPKKTKDAELFVSDVVKTIKRISKDLQWPIHGSIDKVQFFNIQLVEVNSVVTKIREMAELPLIEEVISDQELNLQKKETHVQVHINNPQFYNVQNINVDAEVTHYHQKSETLPLEKPTSDKEPTERSEKIVYDTRIKWDQFGKLLTEWIKIPVLNNCKVTDVEVLELIESLKERRKHKAESLENLFKDNFNRRLFLLFLTSITIEQGNNIIPKNHYSEFLRKWSSVFNRVMKKDLISDFLGEKPSKDTRRNLNGYKKQSLELRQDIDAFLNDSKENSTIVYTETENYLKYIYLLLDPK